MQLFGRIVVERVFSLPTENSGSDFSVWSSLICKWSKRPWIVAQKATLAFWSSFMLNLSIICICLVNTEAMELFYFRWVRNPLWVITKGKKFLVPSKKFSAAMVNKVRPRIVETEFTLLLFSNRKSNNYHKWWLLQATNDKTYLSISISERPGSSRVLFLSYFFLVFQ